MWSKPIGRKSVLGMAVSLLHLLVIILGLSQFASLDAVPISRTRDLSHGYKGYQVSETTRLVITGETWKKLSIGVGRKNIEINDYPEFGANNRHQKGATCFEC